MTELTVDTLLSLARDVFAVIGVSASMAAVIVGILYYWHKDPKNLELMLSQVLHVLAFLGTSGKKWQIKFSLQGQIGRHIRDLEKETGEYAPYNLSIRWVPEESERQSFLQGQTVVARLSYDDNPHLNYLTALSLYMKQGFLPQARQFLPSDVRRAMDLATITILLASVGNRAAQSMFLEEILPYEWETQSSAKTPYSYFLDMEEFGLFRRLFLPEVFEYGIRERVGGPRSKHKAELSRFVRWLKDLTSDMEYHSLAELQFADDSIAVHVVPVGVRSKIEEKGVQPYVNAVERCRNDNVDAVYLMARGQSRKIIPEICDTVRDMGLCNVSDTWQFRSKIPGTTDRIDATICRLIVIK